MSKTMHFKPMNLGRIIVWGGFSLLLLVAPMIFSQSGALSLLSQMGTMMIFALSYNMLLGQGGMLSFGHAVYSGLGAFFCVHAMNLVTAGSFFWPVSLMPLLAGFAGMGFGLLFGYVTTKKSGTTFAMITLGLVELVAACSLMFPQFFGGEGGVSTNRVIGEAFLGISFGPQIQVYYLIAAYLLLCSVAMFAFTQTPLGRILNAVRDNPERVEFLGYDSRWVRYLTLSLSAFFAGVSGGLTAINFEIVGTENVSALRSGAILLFVFIGGAGYFFGPMLGAMIGVLLSVVLSDFTKAWLLYLGLFFMLMVMYAPGGLASLVMLMLKVTLAGKLGRIWRQLCSQSAACLLGFAGFVLMVEMLYQKNLESVNGSMVSLFGIAFDSANLAPWLFSLAMLLVGGLWFAAGRAKFAHAWDAVLQELLQGGAK